MRARILELVDEYPGDLDASEMAAMLKEPAKGVRHEVALLVHEGVLTRGVFRLHAGAADLMAASREAAHGLVSNVAARSDGTELAYRIVCALAAAPLTERELAQALGHGDRLAGGAGAMLRKLDQHGIVSTPSKLWRRAPGRAECA